MSPAVQGGVVSVSGKGEEGRKLILILMNDIQKFLQGYRNKPVRIHAHSQTFQGILTTTPSTLVWEVQPENPYVVVKFLESDIYEWDVICNDLVPEIYLKHQ